MNRRNFFKTVTGFVAGVFAGTAKSSGKDLCSGQNGNICPRCKFNLDRILALPAKDWVDAQFNPVKELKLNEPFEGKVVGMCKFGDDLWIATEKGVHRIKGISV